MSMTRNEKKRRRIKLAVDLALVLFLFWVCGVLGCWALTSTVV